MSTYPRKYLLHKLPHEIKSFVHVNKSKKYICYIFVTKLPHEIKIFVHVDETEKYILLQKCPFKEKVGECTQYNVIDRRHKLGRLSTETGEYFWNEPKNCESDII